MKLLEELGQPGRGDGLPESGEGELGPGNDRPVVLSVRRAPSKCSKSPEGPVLRLTPSAWAAFTAGLGRAAGQ
ncbi:DUF397 domain-containing protein [Streptomyces sp. NPDC050485]|uniref:DUF397 domain-containing protein n=1 Tax=Streptomyces sp. NPDC050485 TaxID=3365617 RepID=UPI003787E9BF